MLRAAPAPPSVPVREAGPRGQLSSPPQSLSTPLQTEELGALTLPTGALRSTRRPFAALRTAAQPSQGPQGPWGRRGPCLCFSLPFGPRPSVGPALWGAAPRLRAQYYS